MAASDLMRLLWDNSGNIAAILGLAAILYPIMNVIYNLYFHPLSKYPGPLFNRASRLPYCISMVSGRLHTDVFAMHERYGDIVRLAPDELAFSHPQAWKDIMGHRSGSEVEMGKNMKFYRSNPSVPMTIVNAPREKHGLLRRTMAHGFSDKMMREQEPMIKKYIDKLIHELRTRCENGPIDMAAWYNFTTFDVIGDLAFGEPFGCLEAGEHHPWVEAIFDSMKFGTIVASLGHYPALKNVLMRLVPGTMRAKFLKRREYSRAKMARRMQMGERPDLMDGLIRRRDEWNITIPELEENGNTIVLAGSETTATLLSGATYLLLKNPEALQKLTDEVRSTFASEADINLISVSNLPYMLAVLDETLRVYPPVPIGLPRVVPPSGGKIVDEFVPAGTIVSIYQYASYHRPTHFHNASLFRPERWLHDPVYATDARDMLQPFSVGPRNCLGRNLAYAEMRLILSRIVFNFDMRLAQDEGSQNWMARQKVYFLWHKGPLNVDLVPRAGGGGS